jgi:hypothetical protein
LIPQRRDFFFSDEEIRTAKETDLPDLLSSLGYTVKRVGSYYTTGEMDSLRIKNRRTWFRYSEKRGGDAIDFLQHFCGKSFPEAVDYLLAYHGGARYPRAPPAVPPKKQEVKPFSLPPPNAGNRRVTAYLRKRGIAAQVIENFIKAGLLYEDAEHHNCVFVGRNKDGEAVFAAKRGTYDRNGASFRGGEPGSNKETGFRLPCDLDSLRLFVFEAPIDLMSYCTLHRRVKSNAVALCCLYEGPVDTYLQENPHIRLIDLCLDADGPGREAAEKMKEKYAGKGYVVSIHTPPRGKDWNEYLQFRQKSREKER